MIDSLELRGKKAAYYTLGCKLNFSETASLEERLNAVGMETVREGEVADLCVVNTCSVTQVADRKCRQAIHKAIKEHPGAYILVMGCFAQLQGESIARIEGVDAVVGTEMKKDIMRYLLPLFKKPKGEAFLTPLKDIRTFVPSCSRGSRTRYFLKVQDGCNYFCSYCTIPMARGRSRNPSIASLVQQVRDCVSQGGKEIVLTGVNIGDFGQSTGESFLDLLKALDEVEGVERYRISSLEPDLLSDDMIALVASSRRFMPHFHLPLQCGSDAVLRLMRRHYDTALFASRVERIKRLMPDCFIGVDVMVGARGETPERFEEYRRFLESLDVTQLHVFPYSERPGTQALKLDCVVSEQEKHLRRDVLLKLSEEKTRAFYLRHTGRTQPVLLERARAGAPMHGFTPDYVRVEVPNRPELDNQIVSVRLGALAKTKKEMALVGEIVEL